MTNLLLVEDDPDLAGNIIDYLELEELYCDHASNGMAALQLLQSGCYGVVILDINLPQLDGLSVCQRLREQGNDTPVIMLTARDQLDDKLTGFARGADDYLVKPFAMAELVARVQVLALRRSGQIKQLSCGPVRLNVTQRQAFINEKPIRLSPTVLVILEQLLRATPEPVSRESLEQAIWGDERPDSNSLKVHMHHLRKALSVQESVSVVSLPGAGFRLLLQVGEHG